MPLVRACSACLILMALPFAIANAQSTPNPPAPKPSEVRTQLTPAQSPPLSFAQLRKQALSTAPAAPPPNTAMPGLKAAPFSTSRPADPKLAGERAAMNAAKLARVRVGATYAPMAKPAPVVTIGPASAENVATAKRAKASVAATPKSATAKPPALQTNAPAPAPTPAQLAKQKAVDAAARRQP
jgi:hypothetical protein